MTTAITLPCIITVIFAHVTASQRKSRCERNSCFTMFPIPSMPRQVLQSLNQAKDKEY